MAKPGARNTITDVPGFKVGQTEDAKVRTGVSVIVPDAPAIAAVAVSGGGPGTRLVHAGRIGVRHNAFEKKTAAAAS